MDAPTRYLRRTAVAGTRSASSDSTGTLPEARSTVSRRWENKTAGYAAVAALENPGAGLVAGADATPIARASATA